MDFLDSKNFYYKITLVTLVVIFLEMVLGSWTASIDAGLSCPNWPLCYGQVVPLNTTNPYGFSALKIWSEYTHRVTATLVSIFLVLTAYLTYRHREEVEVNKAGNKVMIGQSRYKIMMVVIVLLAVQIILGALTVIMDTNAVIVTTHLATATIIFGLTVFMATKIKPQQT